MKDELTPVNASVCDLLDRVLDRGVVLEGDILISVAGVDLIYLRLEALLSSVAKAIEAGALRDDKEGS